MTPIDLCLDPTSTTGVIAAKLLIKVGSCADPIGKRGAHQLLGSLLSRGCGPHDQIAVANLVEGCGAGLRCDTSEDGLLISLKCSEKDAALLLPLLGWMIKDPHLDPDQISLERELSIQAIQRQKENPFFIAFDAWRYLAYGDGPYGHDPLGIKKELMKITREDLISLAKQLTLEKTVLAISGDITEALKIKLNKITTFGVLVKQRNETNIKITKTTETTKSIYPFSNIILRPESTGQVVMMLGQATIPHGHIDDLALRLLNCHLGSGMSSLLFKRLREENGVAYDVGIHHPARNQAAPFVLHASTSEGKALMSLKLLIEVWWEQSEKELSSDQLSLAKAKFRGQLAHENQTSSQRAERKAQLLALDLAEDFDSRSLNSINSLSAIDLKEAAKRHLQSPLLSLCGPQETIEKLSSHWDSTYR